MNGAARILKDLLDSAGKLVGRLGPIVVFHGDHKNRFDSVFAIFLCWLVKWPTVNNRANAPSMPKRLTCDIDSSRYLRLAASAGWQSRADRGDHRATGSRDSRAVWKYGEGNVTF